MAEEWGPWIDHDGKSKPKNVYGCFVRCYHADGLELDVVSSMKEPQIWEVNLWDWNDCKNKGDWSGRIIRYRIRKPKGLTILESLLEDLPQDVNSDEWTRV